MTIRERLHRLVEDLPEGEMQRAERLLAALKTGIIHPVDLALLLAPEDDEPHSSEEEKAVQQARDALARGELVPDEELRRRLGR